MSSFTNIHEVNSDAKTLTTELSMGLLSSEPLDQSSDGFAVIGKVDDKLTGKANRRHPTAVRPEVGQVGLGATTRGGRQ